MDTERVLRQAEILTSLITRACHEAQEELAKDSQEGKIMLYACKMYLASEYGFTLEEAEVIERMLEENAGDFTDIQMIVSNSAEHESGISIPLGAHRYVTHIAHLGGRFIGEGYFSRAFNPEDTEEKQLLLELLKDCFKASYHLARRPQISGRDGFEIL